MVNCDYCHKKNVYLAHTCKFCKNNHCSEHLLPENHKCNELKEYYKRGGYFQKLKKTKPEKYEDNFVNTYYVNEDEPSFQAKTDSRNGFWIFLVIFIFILIFAYYYFQENSMIIGSKEYNENRLIDNRTSIYSSELHWEKIPVKYGYDDIDSCYPLKVNLTKMAISEITRLTGNAVTFQRDDENPEILFKCLKDSKYDLYRELETKGEAEYYAEGNVITSAIIYLYGGVEKGCEVYPSVELHELLHTFGINHNTRAGSVMIAVSTKCIKSTKLSVDKEIYDKLRDIYS